MIMMVFAMPAYAQRMGGGKQHGAKADQAQSKEQQEKKHAAEQGYKDACCDRHSQSGE
jgi:Tfp pilus assembly protein PilE